MIIIYGNEDRNLSQIAPSEQSSAGDLASPSQVGSEKKSVSFSIKSFKSSFQLKIPPLPTITEQVRLIFYLELKLQKNIVFKT